METHTYTISKEKPYFIIPVIEGKEGIFISRIIPEVFNPGNDLKVIIRSELNNRNEETEYCSLLNFIDKYSNEKEFIPFFNKSGERYLMVSLLLGKKDSSGKFIEMGKLDPDKFGEFKLLVEYRFRKIPEPEHV